MAAGEVINVGLGKIAVAQPPGVLACVGVGSCVALCIYHRPTRTAALAHIMLPARGEGDVDPKRPAKFAGDAVENVLEALAQRGIKAPTGLVAKLVGGAHLFHFHQVPNIGARNIEATRKALAEFGIPIVAQDVGGSYGRSVWFFAQTGKVVVRGRFHRVREI